MLKAKENIVMKGDEASEAPPGGLVRTVILSENAGAHYTGDYFPAEMTKQLLTCLTLLSPR